MTDSFPIEITGLVKKYGGVPAVDHLDLRVRAGTVHGNNKKTRLGV